MQRCTGWACQCHTYVYTYDFLKFKFALFSCRFPTLRLFWSAFCIFPFFLLLSSVSSILMFPRPTTDRAILRLCTTPGTAAGCVCHQASRDYEVLTHISRAGVSTLTHTSNHTGGRTSTSNTRLESIKISPNPTIFVGASHKVQFRPQSQIEQRLQTPQNALVLSRRDEGALVDVVLRKHCF